MTFNAAFDDDASAPSASREIVPEATEFDLRRRPRRAASAAVPYARRDRAKKVHPDGEPACGRRHARPRSCASTDADATSARVPALLVLVASRALEHNPAWARVARPSMMDVVLEAGVHRTARVLRRKRAGARRRTQDFADSDDHDEFWLEEEYVWAGLRPLEPVLIASHESSERTTAAWTPRLDGDAPCPPGLRLEECDSDSASTSTSTSDCSWGWP